MRRRPGAVLATLVLFVGLAAPGPLDGAARAPVAAAAANLPGMGWPVPAGRSSRDVTDYGRSVNRNHYTTEEPGFPMCLLWTAPLGKSRSQPLIVRADFDGTGHPYTLIFHMAGDSLWALNADVNLPRIDPHLPVATQIQMLWDAGFIKWRQPLQDAESPGELAYLRGADPQQDVIYAMTGQPSIATFRAVDGTPLRQFRLPRSEGYTDCTGATIRDWSPDMTVVTAPLVFPDGTVVLGTTDGEVYIIRNLNSPDDKVKPVVSKRCVGGRLSSAPVPVGLNAFAIAADARQVDKARPYGYLAAFYIYDGTHRDFQSRWPRPVFTPAGIPGEVAIDGTLIYFADKHGTVYAATLDDGRIVWNRLYPGLFINKGPGVGAEEVYLAIRSRGGAGEGSLLSVRKRTGEQVWRVALRGDGNTAPVPLAPNPALGGGGLAPGLILVGDTRGHVSGWRDGAQAYFAVPERCYMLTAEHRGGRPLPPISADLTLTNKPYKGGRWWDSINGAGTQMTVAYDLMLLGVNSTDDRESALHGYRLLPAVNFKVSGRVLADPPYAPGATVPVELDVTANVNQPVQNMSLAVGWAVDGRVASARVLHLDWPAGESRRTVRVEMPLPGSAAEFWAAANPEALRQDPRGLPLPAGLWGGGDYNDLALAYELDLSDNIWRRLVEAEPGPGPGPEPPPGPPGDRPPGGPLGGPPDGPGGPGEGQPPGGGLPPGVIRPGPGPDVAVDWLSVPVDAPASGFSVGVQISNRGADRVRTTLLVRLESSIVGRVDVALEPGEAREVRFFSWPWPPNSNVTTVAILDPDNRLKETDETNNRREAMTLIQAPPPGESDSPPDMGSRLTG